MIEPPPKDRREWLIALGSILVFLGALGGFIAALLWFDRGPFEGDYGGVREVHETPGEDF